MCSAPAGRTRVVVDPIDGSVNAKRGIPFFSFSLAVAEGATMGDVTFGYVYDFGSGEEWTAERERGAFLDGERLGALRPKETIEILSFEGTTTPIISDRIAPMLDVAERVRVMGSLALSLCHLAAGRVDGVVSLKPLVRSTSPPRSCSSASAASRSSCSRIRRSSPPRSISAPARVSPRPRSRTLVERLAVALLCRYARRDEARPRRDPESARERHRSRAAAPGHGARHGARRPRRRRRLGLGDDRSHGCGLSAARLVPGAGLALRRRGSGCHARAARLRRHDARGEVGSRHATSWR